MSSPKKIIVLDAAGDVETTGRKLSYGYERAEALKCVQKLKSKLETLYNVQVILTRNAGDKILPLQAASFANRLQANLFIRLHIYKETTAVKPKLFIYHHVVNPLTDYTAAPSRIPQLLPLARAHTLAAHTSRMIGNDLYKALQQERHKKIFDCYANCGIPLKTIYGITQPALLLEIGINQDHKWLPLIDGIAEGFEFLR